MQRAIVEALKHSRQPERLPFFDQTRPTTTHPSTTESEEFTREFQSFIKLNIY